MAQHSVIIDSSVWISFLNKGDSFHYEAMKVIGKYTIKKYLFVIPLVVAIEIITVLTRNNISSEKIINLINGFKEIEKYQIISLSKDESLYMALKYRTIANLRSLDYIIFLHLLYYKPTRFETFDKKLRIAYNQNNAN